MICILMRRTTLLLCDLLLSHSQANSARLMCAFYSITINRPVCILSHCSPKVGRGSGFIAELPISRAEKKVVLMTCNHVLPSLAVAQKANIYFGRRSKTNPGTMIEGQELFNDQFFLTDDRTVRLILLPKSAF